MPLPRTRSCLHALSRPVGGVDIVKTYDPRNGIVYRHVDAALDTASASLAWSDAINRLPSGYANGSPRTYLRSPRRISSAA